MTDAPRWWSQPFPPEGGQTAEGIKRQLGRPGLDEYAVLVREAAQNSWDARRDDSEVIDFSIVLRRLGHGAKAWRDRFGPGATSSEGLGLLDRLHSDSWVLTVSDRGTSGLGGPIRADERSRPGEVADFVQFIRNVGEPRDKSLGGGTYGFGKGIFYRISRAGVIVVDTLNDEGDARSRRMMGAALGPVDVDTEGRRLTGRHWWGAVHDDIPDPVLGDEADRLAQQLGLPGFEDGRTGTDVTIVLPSLELDELESDARLLGEKLRGYIYWYLWPKMVRTEGRQWMRFRIDVDGEELEFPDITDMPVLRDFAESLTTVRGGGDEDFVMKTHAREFGRLGRLSLQLSFSAQTSSDPVWESVAAVSPIEPPYRHVARMRQAELVVDYFEGDPMPDPAIGYTGSFVTSASVDDFFAAAEPPTHDAWEIASLTGSARGIVQRSRAFIADVCRRQVESHSGGRTKTVKGLGRLAGSLGALVQGAPGTKPAPGGGQRRDTGPGGGGGGRKDKVRVVRSSYVVMEDGMPFVESMVEVPESVGEDTRIVATAAVVIAGGRKESTGEVPLGADGTQVLGWWDADRPDVVVQGPVLARPALAPGMWKVRAQVLPDVAVTIGIVQEDDDA